VIAGVVSYMLLCWGGGGLKLLKVDAFQIIHSVKPSSIIRRTFKRYLQDYNILIRSRTELHMLVCNIKKRIYNHKSCMHSILPLAPGVKQPALHFIAT